MAIQEEPSVCDVYSGAAPGPAAPQQQINHLLPIPVPVSHRRSLDQRSTRFRFTVVVVLLLLLVVAELVSLALVYLFSSTEVTTITITPRASAANQVVLLQAVFGAPSSLNQIHIRSIDSTSPTRTAPITATGTFRQPARAAQGTITFYNIAPFAQTIPAGTRLSARGGVQVQTMADVTVLAGNAPYQASASVAAQATQTGPIGNIPAYAVSMECCTNQLINGIYAKNETAFSGGQDAEHYALVRQGDIDQADGPLIGPSMQDALKAFRTQVRTTERLVSAPTCMTAVKPTVPSGGRAFSQAAVSVSVSCRGEAYSWQDAVRRAGTLFSWQEMAALGPSYQLSGSISVVGAVGMVRDEKRGTTFVSLPLAGLWVFQIDRSALSRLLPLLVGKTWGEAQTMLQGIPGVYRVELRPGEDHLPTDAGRIVLSIETPRVPPG